MLQLADLNEAKRAALRRADTLERANSSASHGAQQYESQMAGLRQQVRDAQAAARLAEAELAKVRYVNLLDFLKSGVSHCLFLQCKLHGVGAVRWSVCAQERRALN